MLRTVEATIDKNGNVKLAESVKLGGKRRALVTILESVPVDSVTPRDWFEPDEDRAWRHLSDLPDLDRK